jgi:hypothetical protein
VFLVKLRQAVNSTREVCRSPKPGISAIAAGTSMVVVRMINPDAALSTEYPVQNLVAFTTLGKEALRPFQNAVVPLIYDWMDNSKNGAGWSIIEYLLWVNISETFDELDVESQQKIMSQIAESMKCLQDFEVPTSHFGGLGFDDHGAYIGRPMNLPCGGPFESYADLVKGMLDWQLAA